MNLLEQISNVYKEEYNDFLQFYNDRAMLRESEVTDVNIRLLLLERAILKLNKQDNETLQTILNILRLIELPSKN